MWSFTSNSGNIDFSGCWYFLNVQFFVKCIWTIILRNIRQNWWFSQLITELWTVFYGWYFLKSWLCCLSKLFFWQKSPKFKIDGNFFRNWCFLNPWLFCLNTQLFHRKPAKYMIFRNEILKFQIELHSILGKIRKLSLLIGSKKWPWTLKNCPALHKNRQMFWKRGVSFHKCINFQKTQNFSRGFLNFWWESRPEIQALTGFEFHFFLRKGVSLPTFTNGRELTFLEGIKKTLSLFYNI